MEIAKAVMESVMNGDGHTFSVEIARQGGKNELSAQLEVLVLTLFCAKGGNLVKCSPTFKPQTVISMMRLKERLNDWGFDGVWVAEQGYMIRLFNALAVFLSADEAANVVGNTAHLLLEVDESQDVGKDKYTKEFKPMGATTNVTTVHYGTTWDDTTLLEEVKQTNLELEKKDGVRRHFAYDWQAVAKFNPEYLKYVTAERARLGENHPLFLTQYALQPIRGGGRFLSILQRQLLQGNHPRQRERKEGSIYVAGIDLAGEAEDVDAVMVQALSPKRDSTVLTIAEIIPPAPADILQDPVVNIVEHYSWTGIKHADLYNMLRGLIKDIWCCRVVFVDNTGIGQPVASFLKRKLGRTIVPFTFNQRSKSDIGFDLLSFVNSGRLKMYQSPTSLLTAEFWYQMEKAKSIFRPSQTMNFFVEPSEGHDDFLMSLALVVQAAKDYRPPRVAKGVLSDA